MKKFVSYFPAQNFPNPLTDFFFSKISILKSQEAVLNVLDEQIERFVRKLRKLPRKTIVIFQTDNGGSSGNGCNYPYRGGKSQLDEGGTLSPTFVLPINHKFPIKQRPSLFSFFFALFKYCDQGCTRVGYTRARPNWMWNSVKID